jgi:hypothetical protein
MTRAEEKAARQRRLAASTERRIILPKRRTSSQAPQRLPLKPPLKELNVSQAPIGPGPGRGDRRPPSETVHQASALLDKQYPYLQNVGREVRRSAGRWRKRPAGRATLVRPGPARQPVVLRTISPRVSIVTMSRPQDWWSGEESTPAASVHSIFSATST